MKNHGEGKKWIAGTVVKKIGAVNYHVVVCGGSQILHRHADQLISRIPKLGASEESTQIPPVSRAENEVVIQESERKSRRVREAPEWTKDYEMSTI